MSLDKSQDTIKDVLEQAKLVSEVTKKSEIQAQDLKLNSEKKLDGINTNSSQNVLVNKSDVKQSSGEHSNIQLTKDLKNNNQQATSLQTDSSYLDEQLKKSKSDLSSTKKENVPLLNTSQPIFHSNRFQVTSQAKTFLAGSFTLLFAFLLVIGAIRPTVSDIVRIKNQLKTYKRIAVQLDDKIDTIYQLKEVLAQKKATLAYFDVYYPHNLDYSLFVSNLEYVTRQEKAKLLSVNYSEHVGNEYIKVFKKRGIREIVPVVFSISIQGDYNQLISFLKQLEDTPYLPQVITMGYRADQRDQTRTFTLNVLLFRLKKPILKLKSNEDILKYVSGSQ